MDELRRRAAQLDVHVQQLDNTTAANTAALDRVHVRLDRGDRDRKMIVAALLGALMLVAFVGYVAFRAERTASDQEELRGKVLCPVFARFVGAYEPETRALNLDGSYDGSDRESYDINYNTIRDSYDLLRCTSPIVPPRQPGT